MKYLLRLVLAAALALTVAKAQPVNISLNTAIALPTTSQSSTVYSNINAPDTFLTDSAPDQLYVNVGLEDNPTLVPFTTLTAPGSIAFSYRRNIWYSWTAPSTGTLSIATLNNYESNGISIFDTTLALFKKVEDNVYLLQSYNDDSLYNLGSLINTTVEGGVEYMIAAGGWGGDQGNAILRLQFVDTSGGVIVYPAFPDNFEDAALITNNRVIASGSNEVATTEPGEPNHANANGTKSVWFRYTAAYAGKFTITTQGSTFNTGVAIYEGTQFDALTLVAQNLNTTFAKTYSTIKGAPGKQGGTYYIAITGFEGAGGNVEFDFSYKPTPPGFDVPLADQTVLQSDDALFEGKTRTTDATLLADNENIDSGISFRWERQPAAGGAWTPLVESATYVGVATENLTVVGATLAMNRDKFRLVVTDVQGTGISRVATLHVTAFPPVFTRVQGPVDIDLTDGLGAPPGTRYVAKGLPKGLTLDPLTGEITGTVGTKTGTFLIQYYSIDENGVRSDTLRLSLIVDEFLPKGTKLAYEALLEDGLGLPSGRATVNITATGAFTGKLDPLAGKSVAFRGALALNTALDEASAVVFINRGKNLNRYRLTLNLVEADGTLSGVLEEVDANNNVIDLIGDTAAFTELRTVRTSLASASPYTLGLVEPLNMGVEPLPEGGLSASGELRANTNRLNLRGHLGDGTPFTASLATGLDDSFRLFALPYRKTQGYLAGWFSLVARPHDTNTDPGADPGLFHVDPAASEDVYWLKAASADVAFPAGFGPVGLRANLEPWRYSRLAFNTGIYLGTYPTGAVDIVINGSGIDNSGLNPLELPTTANLDLQNKIVVAAPNPTAFAIKLNAKTGAFTGSFRFVETIGGRDFKRTAKINGVFIQQASDDTSDIVAIGHFSVPAATRGAPPRVGIVELRKPVP